MDTQELANQILSSGFMFGVGVIVGVVVAAIAGGLLLDFAVRIMKARNAVDDYREMRKQKAETNEKKGSSIDMKGKCFVCDKEFTDGLDGSILADHETRGICDDCHTECIRENEPCQH